MASDPARSRDPEYPNLPAEVIGAYRDPAPGMVVEVYRRVTDGWLLVLSASGEDVVRAEPFDATGLDLATLWRW